MSLDSKTLKRKRKRYLDDDRYSGCVKLEKLRRNIARDQEYSRKLRNYVDTYDSVMKKKDIISISLYNSLRNFHWQLEEYRVSLFAQQLTTKTPISSKRLDEAWKIIDGRLCHEIARS